MVAIRDGHYAHTTLPDPSLGPRRVDVDRLYDTGRIPPDLLGGKLGEPLLLLAEHGAGPRLSPAVSSGRAGPAPRSGRATAEMSSSAWPSGHEPALEVGRTPA